MANYDEKELLKFGFEKRDHGYRYKHVLNDDLYAIFDINDDISISVYEIDFDLEYLPLSIKGASGKYISSVKKEVDLIKRKIIENCYINNNMVEEIKKYISKYDCYIEFPWDKTPKAFTMKCSSNNKWFGIYMNVTYKQLGFNDDTEVDVINLKLFPEHINTLIDNKKYFKAYHMNKKYWMTIALDHNANKEEVFKLIDEAYNIVNGG